MVEMQNPSMNPLKKIRKIRNGRPIMVKDRIKIPSR